MSQIIPFDVCRLREINENKVAYTLKLTEKNKEKIQHYSKVFKNEVENLYYENTLLDKGISFNKSLSLKLEKEMSILKTQIEELACITEHNQWKMYKLELVKEFESQRNKTINDRKFKHEHFAEPTSSTLNSFDTHKPTHNDLNRIDNDECTITLKEKIVAISEEIKRKKTAIQMTDPKLYVDIQTLQKRNSALQFRYQRQLQEAEIRYKQTLCELSSLQKLLAEKNTILSNQTSS